jgi:excisionase family DNA binding protein
MKNDAAAEIPEIMTLGDLAEYLHCHRSTVLRLIKHGELKGFRLGTDWRFRREDVDLWISGRQTRPIASKPSRQRRRKK